MKTTHNRREIAKHVEKQLKHLFNYKCKLIKSIDNALNLCKINFSKNQNKYYSENDQTSFNIYHSGQYAIFLYYLAHSTYLVSNDRTTANLLYYLNKVLHSVDWYYEIKLPDYFGVEHPVSSVLGRAKYSNGLFIYQGCTIGGNNGFYPTLGENVVLYSNSSILGKCIIGDNVLISTGSIIIDQDIPSNSIVFGRSPNLVIKKIDELEMKKKINHFWKY